MCLSEYGPKSRFYTLFLLNEYLCSYCSVLNLDWSMMIQSNNQWWDECGKKKAIYKGCFESSPSYFFILVHDLRGRCWSFGNRSWTFPPIFHYILLLCNGWQQRGSLTWKCTWSKDMSCNFSLWKKSHWHSSILAESLWRPNSDQTGGGWCRWQWVTLLTQIFTCTAFRLLFIA